MRVIGPQALKCVCDLRRRPALVQKVVHRTKEHSVHQQLGATPGFEALAASPHTSGSGVVITFPFRHKSRTARPSGSELDFVGDRGRAMQGKRNVAH